MKWIENASLRQRLSLPIIIFALSLFVMFYGYNYVSTYKTEKDNLINRIKILSIGVSLNLKPALILDDKVTANKILDAFSADEAILQAVVMDNDGQIFIEYKNTTQLSHAPNAELKQQMLIDGYAIGDHFIYVSIPFALNPQEIAQINLIVSKDILEETRDTALKMFIFMLLFFVICGYFIISKIQKWVITPVSSLNHAMQGIITRGVFDERPQVVTQDELGDLTASFNKMTSKLEERQKQLSYVLKKVEHERDFGEQIITAVQHALFVIDKKGLIILSNEASKVMFPSLSINLLESRNLLDVIQPSNEEDLLEIIDNRKEVDDLLIQTCDSKTLQITSRVLSNQNQVLLSMVDVTEALRSRTQQKLAANVFKNSQDGVLIYDADGKLTLMNPAFTDIFGYQMSELSNIPMLTLFDGHHFTTSTSLITESIQRFGQWHGEVLEKDKYGAELPLYVKASKIIDTEQYGQNSYIFIFTNLSDVKEKERLDHLAHHDVLTGLPNRAKFYQAANDTILLKKGSIGQMGLCYLDLDGFKQINDTYGHDAGDEVLRVVAKRLEHAVRANDLASRLAGDEFVLFINPVANREQLIELADRVIFSIQAPISYKGTLLSVNVSIGITIADYNDGKDVDALLKESDKAMYEAKLTGKGKYMFHKI
ncbi:diguanylate cyclase [Aliivibrio fischeri]|uniref:putative bifunctional diguanylate cyclase/phosphodiesterase n=1 Tax=Aliivibrio fischeri TaxID=668 RepID=UPI001F343184|nr:diguanylate cyclase [Aliivibrio fischeri]MCE7578429.1 diguanylate cyclase [Aliivibrio fischeri]MCE7590869.1 diguanylate cyclase [Aliivibrio fischeri]